MAAVDFTFLMGLQVPQSSIQFHVCNIPLPFKGTGMTFTLRAIINSVRGQGKIALCCAASAAAAILYPGGRTSHSLFKFDVKDDSKDPSKFQCRVPRDSARAKLISEATIVNWDEFTMTHRHNFEAVEELLRKLKLSDQICGGILTIGAGDFRQTLPSDKDDQIQVSILKTTSDSQEWLSFVYPDLETGLIKQHRTVMPKKFVRRLSQ